MLRVNKTFNTYLGLRNLLAAHGVVVGFSLVHRGNRERTAVRSGEGALAWGQETRICGLGLFHFNSSWLQCLHLS